MQQPIDRVVFFELGELLLHIVGREFGLRRGGGFRMAYLFLHAIERGGACAVIHLYAGASRLLRRARAAMVGDERVTLGASLLQFLLQFEQRNLQVLHLRLLIFHLLAETARHRLITHRPLDCRARQIVIVFIERHLGPAHPLLFVLLAFMQLLVENMLVGDRDSHLRLYLQ